MPPACRSFVFLAVLTLGACDSASTSEPVIPDPIVVDGGSTQDSGSSPEPALDGGAQVIAQFESGGLSGRALDAVHVRADSITVMIRFGDGGLRRDGEELVPGTADFGTALAQMTPSGQLRWMRLSKANRPTQYGLFVGDRDGGGFSAVLNGRFAPDGGTGVSVMAFEADGGLAWATAVPQAEVLSAAGIAGGRIAVFGETTSPSPDFEHDGLHVFGNDGVLRWSRKGADPAMQAYSVIPAAGSSAPLVTLAGADAWLQTDAGIKPVFGVAMIRFDRDGGVEARDVVPGCGASPRALVQLQSGAHAALLQINEGRLEVGGRTVAAPATVLAWLDARGALVQIEYLSSERGPGTIVESAPGMLSVLLAPLAAVGGLGGCTGPELIVLDQTGIKRRRPLVSGCGDGGGALDVFFPVGPSTGSLSIAADVGGEVYVDGLPVTAAKGQSVILRVMP